MRRTRQTVVIVNALVLSGGALVGWLYGHADWGLMVAAIGALAWNLRQLLLFESALTSQKFGRMKYGDSIWSQMYSKYTFQRQRIKYYRKNHRRLLKEVRKSTNAMPDGGIILNDQFEIVQCNRAAQRLAGFKRKQDRGQRVDNILRDPSFGAYLKSGDFSEGIEIRSPVSEGGWLHCRIVPYGADQRLLLIQDVTERRRLAAMRREFVANASHELRSPLTVISGYLDTMGSEPGIPDDWRKPLDQMQVQAARMTSIVAELLELSRLEGAGAAPRDEVVDICGLLSAARKSQEGRPDVPSIELQCESLAQMRGSTAEVESVIENLLSNAIRYTDENGSVTLSWSTDEGGGRLSVIDTGIGIDPEHLPRLTERFFRVDPGRAREDGGVGLGLAIVKHILERHDASLDIQSAPGEGSRFTCIFPVSRIVTAEPIPIAGGASQ